MEELKIKEYKISRMTIENDVISWEGHALRIEGIARAWVGGMPEKSFPFGMSLILLMIALSGQRVINMAVMLVILGVYLIAHFISWKSAAGTSKTDHVNLELYSGNIYSIAAGSELFAGRLHEVLKNILAAGTESPHYEIRFGDGGEIIDHSEDEKPAEASIMEAKQVAGQNGEIVEELKTLYECYTRKTDSDSEILSLINEAGRLVEKNDKDGLKSAFGRFVTSGLINDCNVLGLDSLLQEIRTMIY